MRWVLGVLGVVVGGYGAVLLLGTDPIAVLPWLLGGPLVHDLVLAPAVAGIGILIARLPTPGPVRVGAVLTGVLCLLAVPLLWRPHAGRANPGLLDRPYLVGLLVVLAVIWSGCAAVPLWTRWIRRRRSPKPQGLTEC